MILTVNEQTFKKEVLESPTPVLVHFWAPWCGLCRMINPFLTRLQAESSEPMKIVGVNADESLKLANTYRLTNLPTLIMFVSGEPIHRLEGFSGREDLRQKLEKIQLSALATSA